MANNLPEDLKHDWVDNEIVMPADVNAWSSATNTIKDVIPLYATAGNFYTATYTSNTYNLTPITVDGKTNVPPTAYIDGMSIVFKCPTDNQANCKVKIGSLTAKSIYSLENVNLPAGKLKQGCYIELKFDSLNDCFKFQQDLNKADVGEVVDLTSNQIIEGVKEFTEIIQGTVDKSIKDSDGNDISQTYVKNTDNKFHALKGYSDKGELLEDAEGLADVIEYAHSTFDSSKFTAYGSPIITNDGIASDFSGTNGIYVPTLTPGTSSWEIGIEQEVTAEAIADSNPAFVFFTDNADKGVNVQSRYSNANYDDFIIAIKFSDGTASSGMNCNTSASGLGKCVAGDKQKCILGYDGISTYYFKGYKNGVLYASSSYTSSTSQIIQQDATHNTIGFRRGLRGTKNKINLKTYYVKIGGIIEFSGNKTGIDTIKPDDYTVVGTPTISADGVASGFSGTSYITIPNLNISGATDFEFITPYFKVGEILSGISQIINWTLESGTQFFVIKRYNNDYVEYRISQSGTVIGATKVVYVEANKFYQIKFVYKNQKWNTYHREKGGTWTQSQTNVEDATGVTITGSRPIGWQNSSQYLQNGSIDLNALKIYVDGNLVYQPCLKIPYTESKTGSKVVNAIYRDRVNDIAEQFGYANYYTLNENKANNYVVVGTPTISADGVASGLDSSNYITLNNITLGNEWELTYKIIWNTATRSNSSNILQMKDGTVTFQILNQANKAMTSSIYGMFASTQYITYITSDEVSQFTDGDIVIINLKVNNNTLYYTVFKNGTVFKNSSISSITNNIGTLTEFAIGLYSNSATTMPIDLNSFKIYVDGKLAYKAIQPPCFTLPQVEVYGMIGRLQQQSDKLQQLSDNEIGLPIPALNDYLYDNEIWLEGAEVSKTTYHNLYHLYGDGWGTPLDSSNFVLPDFRNRAIWGADSYGYLSAGLPNITGNMEVIGDHPYVGADGSFYIQNVGMGGNPIDTTPDGSSDWRISFNASRSSSIYGASNTVQPPAIKVRFKTRFE